MKQLNFKFNPMRKIVLVFLTSYFLLLFYSCHKDTQDIKQPNWTLVWQDEFNTIPSNGLPDSTKWTYDIGNGLGGWGNGEYEYYTNNTKNVSVDTVNGVGCLKITAIQESYAGASYTSARIKTLGLFQQTYGRFEARIKLPWGPGIWPAFWLLGANNQVVGWPQCGEIDIMELKGQQPSIVHGSLHGPGYSGGGAITQTYGLEFARFDTDYHIFAVEWTEDHIDYYVDETMYERINKSDVEKKGEWVFDHPFYIILNLAVGGNYVSWPTADTKFPQTMYVDYVRVYKAN